MKTLITLLLACCFGSAMAQSNLPACQGEVRTWTNCFGTDGGYVGEYKNDLRDGQGILFRPDGTIKESGVYEKGVLVRSEVIDPAIFTRIEQAATFSIEPSFDCLKARTLVEKIICASPNLAQIDSQMANMYQTLRTKSVDSKKIRNEQREWLKNKRNICEESECLMTVYKDRVRLLAFNLSQLPLRTTKEQKAYQKETEFESQPNATELALTEVLLGSKPLESTQQATLGPLNELEKALAEAEEAKRKQAELQAQLAAAQQTTKPTVAGPTLRVHAMVIGNGDYQGSARLDNPINDARAMSAKLRQMGFKVTTVENATRSKLVRALVGFNRSASATDVSMFFYAGHAAQISGINYMLPTDINMNDLSEVPLHGISLNSVIDQYLPGKTKLVFLDACRDNPLLQVASRSVSRGLAPISVSEGVMIAYATKDGSVAADGNGKNSPFTKALLQHIDGPDDISVVLRKVRAEVMQDTDGKQQPWDYNSLTGGSLILSAIRAK